jgi:hypothetical protein
MTYEIMSAALVGRDDAIVAFGRDWGKARLDSLMTPPPRGDLKIRGVSSQKVKPILAS